jgi:asparagine synthase (glutamine-hydrolysing)
MVDELLSEENINRRGFLNYSVVKRMIDNDRNGIDDYAYQIYQLLTLELWFREYIDNDFNTMKEKSSLKANL